MLSNYDVYEHVTLHINIVYWLSYFFTGDHRCSTVRSTLSRTVKGLVVRVRTRGSTPASSDPSPVQPTSSRPRATTYPSASLRTCVCEDSGVAERQPLGKLHGPLLQGIEGWASVTANVVSHTFHRAAAGCNMSSGTCKRKTDMKKA